MLCSLLFSIYCIYRIRPYERYLHERESKIQEVIKEILESDYSTFNPLYIMNQFARAIEAGKPERALCWVELGATYFENVVWTYLARAEAYYCLEKYQNALENYEAALSEVQCSEEPGECKPSIPTGLAKSHYQLGHEQEAALYFVEAILKYDRENIEDARELINEIFIPSFLEKGYEKVKITRSDVLQLLEKEKENSIEKMNIERAIELLK